MPTHAPRLRAAPAIVRAAATLVLAACSAAPTDLSSPSASAGASDCSSGNPTLAVGQTTIVTGGSLCAGGGGAGAEYALVAFNGAATPSSQASVALFATDVETPATPLAALLGAPSAPADAAAPAEPDLTAQLDARLRAEERATLTPRIDAARAAMAARRQAAGVARAVIPSSVTVGQLLTLNASATSACTTPNTRTGRVVAITDRSVVVADVENPANGYTDTEYRDLGVTFDTLVHPLAVAAFGEPTDIDDNGRALLFFTREVNALTPRGSTSYVGGFFFARDLFPTTTTNGVEGCATSNYGEMFYLMVPDPTGAVNGNVYTKTQTSRIVVGIVAHEYQHLINASRRLYVNTQARELEETWLDEGLSHVAEELLFYAQARLRPRANLDAAAVRSSQTTLDAFNAYAITNFARLRRFLASPSSGSPYADDDSLSTRGAAWSFLRYAADHRGTDDGRTWYELVNSTTTGRATLTNVFGADVGPLFRDWATSLLLDDQTGVGTRLQEPSWNTRSIVSATQTTGGYPLATRTLAAGDTTRATLAGGGAAYLRFSVGTGKVGKAQWTAPLSVVMTLARVK